MARTSLQVKKNHTWLYDFLEHHFRPYIINKRLHELHHPHEYQINKVINDLFSCYIPNSRIYSKTINITTCILLPISFHISGYENVFTKLYSRLELKISEPLSLKINRMDTRRQYGRVHNKSIHIKIMISQMIQHKIRYKNLKQVK